MNRLIKFRAWDKNKKVFIPTNTWAVCNIDTNPSALAVMIENWEDYNVGEYMYDYAQDINQFTGLYDKNNIEIYEGDIICFGSETKYCVVFSDACFYLFHQNGLKEIDGSPYRWGLLNRAFSLNIFQIEIIGNIYEHPQLLNNQ